MTPEQLDEARAKEAWRIYMSHHNEPPKGEDEHRVPAEIAARLAREGWTPPEPVDPDLLAFREWLMERRPVCKTTAAEGDWDRSVEAQAYLAGARMAREQERERAEPLVEYVMADALRQGARRWSVACQIIAKYEDGGR